MKPERFWFFAILVVLPRQLFCLRPLVRSGIFKIVEKHPKLRSCAQKILQKDEYYDGRVHELTGECEGLKGNLSNIKADDEGYAYVKKVSSERVFLTPVKIKTPLTLTFADLEYRKRRLEVVTDLNLIDYSIMLSDEPFILIPGGGISRENGFFDIEILPADNGGFELFGYEPKHACNQTINVSGKKTLVSFSFPTDSSIQVSLDNTGHCILPSPISTQRIRHLFAPYDKLYSVTETYDYDYQY